MIPYERETEKKEEGGGVDRSNSIQCLYEF